MNKTLTLTDKPDAQMDREQLESAEQTVAALRAEVERLTKENKFLNAENLELEATQQACKSAERRLAVAVGALIRIARVADSKEGDRFLVMCIANEALQELK